MKMTYPVLIEANNSSNCVKMCATWASYSSFRWLEISKPPPPERYFCKLKSPILWGGTNALPTGDICNVAPCERSEMNVGNIIVCIAKIDIPSGNERPQSAVRLREYEMWFERFKPIPRTNWVSSRGISLNLDPDQYRITSHFGEQLLQKYTLNFMSACA